MGLKEAGLRGSLRNASSVLPAFFDVTVTNTNSPVREGDVLSVDYSANNTGDVQDTQDIRLEIDSVEEDRDSNVTLAGGVSTTGTLQWDTTNENATTYTATVLSNDDSDSVTVEVESAIPDSGLVHELDAQSLSLTDGDTVDPWPDDIGSLSLPAQNTPSYETNTNISQPAVHYNGTDEGHEELGTWDGDENTSNSIAFVAEPLDTSTTGRLAGIEHNGAQFDIRLDSGTWNVTFGSVAEYTGGSYAANNTYVGVASYDGSAVVLDVGDSNDVINNSTSTVTDSPRITIGSAITSLYSYSNVHYVSYYDQYKNQTERQEIIDALESKFSFTSANG